MKRSWIGFALLMAMLLGGILVTRKMGRIHDPIEKQLQQAAQCALDSNWEQAEFLFQQAEEGWETMEHFRSCFADHNPVEEIDGKTLSKFLRASYDEKEYKLRILEWLNEICK